MGPVVDFVGDVVGGVAGVINDIPVVGDVISSPVGQAILPLALNAVFPGLGGVGGLIGSRIGTAAAWSIAENFAISTLTHTAIEWGVGAIASFGVNQLVGSVFSPPAPSVSSGTSIPNTSLVGGLEAQAAGIRLNPTSNVAALPVIYGEVGQLNGIRVLGPELSGADNEFVHYVIVWCEGEIDSVQEFRIDGFLYTDSRFSGLVEVYHHTGTDAQAADSTLVSRLGKWTDSHKLSGVAYTYCRLQYDATAFLSQPIFTAKIRGKKVYDPRSETTVWAQNPALAIRDYLTNSRYGFGFDSSFLNEQSFIDAANYCDQEVSSPVGNMDRYQCNGILNTENGLVANLNSLRTSCRGSVIWSAGVYRMLVDKAEAATFTFDEDNMIGGWSIIPGEKNTTFNRVEVGFFNENRDWQPDIAIYDAADDRTNKDNDQLLAARLSLPFERNIYRATNIAQIEQQQSRQGMQVQLQSTIHGLRVEVGDVVYVKHSDPGWDTLNGGAGKEFRVQRVGLSANDEVTVSLSEYDSTVYDLESQPEADATPDTGLPDPFTVINPTNLTLASGTSQLFTGADGTIHSRLKASWTAPADIFVKQGGYIEVHYKKSADSTWISGGIVRGAQTEVFLHPVEDLILYDVRVRSVNSAGVVAASWVSVLNHQVIGKTAPPPNVSSFLVNRQPDGTREFIFTLSSPPADLAGFKLRYKLGAGPFTWDQMDSILSCGASKLVFSPWETNALAAGTYNIGVKAVDTSGNESTDAVIIVSTLGDPRIKNALMVYDFISNGWPGTKTNCWVNETNYLVADSATDWGNLPATWDAWTVWAHTTTSSFIYEHAEIDFGEDFEFVPLTTVNVVNGNPTIEYNYKTDGGAYSGWGTVTQPIVARYLKIRITVTVVDTTQAISLVDQGYFIAAADSVEEAIEDLDTSTLTPEAGGGVRLPLNKTFLKITNVGIAMQGVGAGYTWELIDKSTSGPHIKMYNASSALAYPTIDALVRGLP